MFDAVFELSDHCDRGGLVIDATRDLSSTIPGLTGSFACLETRTARWLVALVLRLVALVLWLVALSKLSCCW